jgi:hypothetical protein
MKVLLTLRNVNITHGLRFIPNHVSLQLLPNFPTHENPRSFCIRVAELVTRLQVIPHINCISALRRLTMFDNY